MGTCVWPSARWSASARAGHEFKLPFRDHAGWRSYWIRKGASGSGGWQARRDLLSDLFDGAYALLMAAQDRALDSTLAEAVSPHERLGWPEVDTEVGELRRHFRTASTPADYRAVGNDCVHLTEGLSRQVYDHTRHTPAGEDEPGRTGRCHGLRCCADLWCSTRRRSPPDYDQCTECATACHASSQAMAASCHSANCGSTCSIVAGAGHVEVVGPHVDHDLLQLPLAAGH